MIALIFKGNGSTHCLIFIESFISILIYVGASITYCSKYETYLYFMKMSSINYLILSYLIVFMKLPSSQARERSTYVSSISRQPNPCLLFRNYSSLFFYYLAEKYNKFWLMWRGYFYRSTHFPFRIIIEFRCAIRLISFTWKTSICTIQLCQLK